MPKLHAPGEILLASLVFTSQGGAKKRPVLVIRDGGDDDLLVAPVTGQAVPANYDVMLRDWQQRTERPACRLEEFQQKVGQFDARVLKEVRMALARFSEGRTRP